MKYNVCICINTEYECIVEAESEDEAYDEAMEKCRYDMGVRFNPLDDVCFSDCYIDELDEEGLIKD